jgi:predicted GIY-YIG superfamily endonuclease
VDKPETTYIYALKDSRDGLIYYVGKSDHPQQRLYEHLSNDITNRERAQWIANLLESGEYPELEILEEVPITEWQQAEISWISKGRELGWPLTNVLPGGDGPDYNTMVGRRHLDGTRAGETPVDPTVTFTIRIPKSLVEAARQVGGGNLSRGIRLLIKEWKGNGSTSLET